MEITSVSKQSVFIQSDSILQTRSFSQSDVTLQIKDDMNTSCSVCLFTNGFVRYCNYYELFLSNTTSQSWNINMENEREGGLTISLHLKRPVGKSTDVFPALDDNARRKQRFLE